MRVQAAGGVSRGSPGAGGRRMRLQPAQADACGGVRVAEHMGGARQNEAAQRGARLRACVRCRPGPVPEALLWGALGQGPSRHVWV